MFRHVVLALVLASSASAFVAPSMKFSRAVPSFAEEGEADAMDLDLEDMFEIFDAADEEVKTVVTPGTPSMSLALPFATRPAGLDCGIKIAGDRGFDPLGFVKSKEDLLKFRNAEIKHGRLAMLAAAGWPISELADGGLAQTFGLPTDLVGDGLAPSLLNGGLGAISPVYWAVVIASATAVELTGMSLKTDAPGDYGFDPLGLYPSDPMERALRQESELRHSRLAMVAIVGFAAQEFFDKEPVIKETPFFFEPLWKFLGDAGFGDLSRGFIEVPLS